MLGEDQTRTREGNLELATRQATTFMLAYREDPEAWVRLLVTEGSGDQTIYHFDAFWPTTNEQCRLVIQRGKQGGWDVTRLS